MVLMVDEEINLMEETSVMEVSDSSDVEFICGVRKVEPRIGDEYQAEIPPMMSASKRALFLSTPPFALDDSCYAFLIGRPVQVMWIDNKHRKGQGDDNVDMSQSLKSLRSKRSAKIRGDNDEKQRSNLEAVPVKPFDSWEDLDVASFVLGLYTFGKNFTQVKKFMENKKTGDIVLFYYRKFHNSATFHRWSDSRKKRKRNRKCVYGKKLYSGWRQQLMLSRLIPSITDESKQQMLVNVSKSFAEGNVTLEKYVSSVKDLVGLKLLVDAVAIGKEKEDLTVRMSGQMKTKTWFTVSSSVPVLKAYASLSSADIINQLTGCSRLSKARGNDIFWEAVWPRLLARGWHSEQLEDRGYYTPKDNIVFIVPGVKKFSRGKLVKGDHYFDSVSDILTKVASEPELLEFETGGEAVNGIDVAENSSDQSDEELSPSDSQRRRYLKSPCSNHGTLQDKFTVVDTSLAAGGKLCDLRKLKTESLVFEPKTRLVHRDSSVDVEKPLVMPKNEMDPMRFTIIDTSLSHRGKLSGFRRCRHLPCEADSVIKEKTLEKVKDRSKKLSTRQAENNNNRSSSPLLKRRRLSTCVQKEKSCSRESPVLFKHLQGDDDNDTTRTAVHESLQDQNRTREEDEERRRYETVLSVLYTNLKSDDQSKETRSVGPSSSSSPVEIQECSKELRSSLEVISAEHEQNRLGLMSGSDEKRSSNDPETIQQQEEQAVMAASVPNKAETTQKLGSSEQPRHNEEINTDAPRRQSTRKRPLTTRALEALESSYLMTTTSKRTKSTTTKPRKRESSRKKKQTAETCNRRQLLSENGSSDLELAGEEEEEEEDRHIFVKKGQASKPLDQIEDSKPVLTEYRKLPPIVLKLPFKRG